MLTFNKLVEQLKKGNTYLIIGHGSKNQFRYLSSLNKVLKKILKDIPQESNFLYFGDGVNKKKPDIGYAFQLLNQIRPDINIYMIQIEEAKGWGVPNFVKDVYWHNDYTKQCKWGGLHDKKPCSNTKKWLSIHKRVKINKAFILGGGNITLDEYSLIKREKIDYEYYDIERRYAGDGTRKIKNSDSKADRVGVTYKKLKSFSKM